MTHRDVRYPAVGHPELLPDPVRQNLMTGRQVDFITPYLSLQCTVQFYVKSVKLGCDVTELTRAGTTLSFFVFCIFVLLE